MKFSVLLPTRNRLEYLRYAVESVRRQDYQNWEIIVSDNCSKDDIASFVSSLEDTRVKYVRTESFVPVTDNWNNALDHSTGDYVVMLGDDDGLLPGYFTGLLDEMTRFPDPDFAYVSAYFFAYPGVMPDEPHGFLRRDRNNVFTENAAFWLDQNRAHAVTRGYLDFRMPVASNMQFSLISRRKIEELRRNGRFFHSPYPDFYATPALFLRSTKILIVPRPMVIIGITPKSYGFFHFNNRAQDGSKFLHNDDKLASGRARGIMLPGTSYNDSWLLANEELSANFSAEAGMLPEYRNYRFLQIVHGYKKCYFDKAMKAEDLRALKACMTFYERFIMGVGMMVCFGTLRIVPLNFRQKVVSRLRAMIGQHAMCDERPTVAQFGNLMDVFEHFHACTAHG